MLSRNALVIGCAGALGRAVVETLVAKHWRVYGADVVATRAVPGLTSQVLQSTASVDAVRSDIETLVQNTRLDMVINVAGGWAGGSIDSDDVTAGADLMIRQSVFTSVAAGHVFAKQGNAGGLLVLTGALAACEPCPGMVGYGAAKAAVHYLTKTIAADPSKLPAESTVVAILPVTLDTPSNRQAMPSADTSSWTPLAVVAAQLAEWGEGHHRPETGSLVAVQTEAQKTRFSVLP